MADDEAKKWRQTAEYYMQVPWHTFLKPQLVSMAKSGSKLTFTTSSDHLTPAGSLHAGSIYIGLELANAVALIPNVNPGETMMTIDTSYSLIGTVTGEGQQVVLESRMLRRTKRIALFESAAYDAKGNLLAKAKTTKIVAQIRSKL